MRSAIRLTDRASGFGGVSATVSDTSLDVPIDCTPTESLSFGSTCEVQTTADTLIPNYIRESKRTVMSVLGLTIDDPGPNGTGYIEDCPSNCGDGDESTYLRQGVLAP